MSASPLLLFLYKVWKRWENAYIKHLNGSAFSCSEEKRHIHHDRACLLHWGTYRKPSLEHFVEWKV